MTNIATICSSVPRAERIARLNDQLRKVRIGGNIMITSGVKRINGFDADALTKALADYSEFDSDGDPHGERDFGCMTLWGHDLLWKVDYYDTDLKFGSDDPADASVTSRVLTVLLASEW